MVALTQSSSVSVSWKYNRAFNRGLPVPSRILDCVAAASELIALSPLKDNSVSLLFHALRAIQAKKR
jgi:hypothetical protein